MLPIFASAALALGGSPTATADITVLTYNVRGLPFPVAIGRDEALRRICRELAQMRAKGRQPTLVLIQEGFLGDMDALARTSGYPHWARGPARGQGRTAVPAGFQRVAYVTRGEGWGKLTGAGLHVLSDLPITEVRRMVYSACAGWDCLANKGAMLVRVRLPGGGEADVLNTHMNAKGASGVPRARSSRAHNLQTDELLQFVADNRSGGPLIVGGDFKSATRPSATTTGPRPGLSPWSANSAPYPPTAVCPTATPEPTSRG